MKYCKRALNCSVDWKNVTETGTIEMETFAVERLTFLQNELDSEKKC